VSLVQKQALRLALEFSLPLLVQDLRLA